MSTIGQQIIEVIITGGLCHASCASKPEHECIVVWSSGAAEQLDGLIARVISEKDKEIARLINRSENLLKPMRDKAYARAKKAEGERDQLRAEVEHYKAIRSPIGLEGHLNIPVGQWKELRAKLERLNNADGVEAMAIVRGMAH